MRKCGGRAVTDRDPPYEGPGGQPRAGLCSCVVTAGQRLVVRPPHCQPSAPSPLSSAAPLVLPALLSSREAARPLVTRGGRDGSQTVLSTWPGGETWWLLAGPAEPPSGAVWPQRQHLAACRLPSGRRGVVGGSFSWPRGRSAATWPATRLLPAPGPAATTTRSSAPGPRRPPGLFLDPLSQTARLRLTSVYSGVTFLAPLSSTSTLPQQFYFIYF